MASVSSQLMEEVTVHAQSGGLGDAREICADGSYFPNNLRNLIRLREYIFCNRFLQSAHNGEVEQQIVHFSPMRPGFN